MKRTLAPFPTGLSLLYVSAIATSVGAAVLTRWIRPKLAAYEYGIGAYWFLLAVGLLVLAQWILAAVNASDFWCWGRLERSRRRSPPGSPRWDHPWSAEGVRFGGWTSVWSGFTAWGQGMVMTYWVWAILFVVLGRYLDAPGHGWYLFSLVAVLPTLWLLYRVFRASAAGRLMVRFPTFPLGAGGRVTVRLETDEEGPAYEGVHFTLISRPCGGIYDWSLANREGIAPEFELVRDVTRDDGAPEAGGAVEVTFDLPEGAPTTSFTEEPHRRYELWIDAETTSGKWTRRLLVPVYLEDGEDRVTSR